LLKVQYRFGDQLKTEWSGYMHKLRLLVSKLYPLAQKKNSSIDMEELFLTLKTTNMKIFVVVFIT
jgi:hypothetical protein